MLEEIRQVAIIPLVKFRRRIVVTTVVTAGHLVTYGVARGHFSHIFIDESGQAHEPEAIIPVAGLADPGKTKYGRSMSTFTEPLLLRSLEERL